MFHQRFAANCPRTDFPTGGTVVGRRGVAGPTPVGRSIQVRGKISHEEDARATPFVINEIPYQVVQNNLIEKMVDVAKAAASKKFGTSKTSPGKHRTPNRGASQTRLGSTCGGTQAVPIHPTANHF